MGVRISPQLEEGWRSQSQYKTSGQDEGRGAWLGGAPRSRLALAGVHVHLLVAVSAEHGAAPVELALALAGLTDPGRVVTPAAAHHLAAIHATGGPVADTPPSPHRPWHGEERETDDLSSEWGS